MQAGALILVSILVVVFSLLKNGFIFLANHVLAPIRAFLVRDMRNDIYQKVLKLPLSYYTEARKGDVIARISSDVQEIENSVISSLQMLFRDPITIIVYLVFLFSISFNLTIFVLWSCSRWQGFSSEESAASFVEPLSGDNSDWVNYWHCLKRPYRD